MPTSVVFLAGGPGLSASYAKTVLQCLPVARDWAYFEQPGCREDVVLGPITAQVVLTAAAAFVEEHAQLGPVALVAHSWGSWLAAALLERMAPGAIGRVLLLHPVPPTRAGLDEALAALFARVESETKARIAPLMERPDTEAGSAVMQALLPAYCGRDHDLPKLDLRMRLPTYHSVMASLGDYDHRSILAANLQRITLAFGQSDCITPDLYGRHADSLARFDVASLRGGHFGFLEDPGFATLLERRGF